MMIKKIYTTGLYRYFHLKNAGRHKRIGHNTYKSMGAVLCVVGHIHKCCFWWCDGIDRIIARLEDTIMTKAV